MTSFGSILGSVRAIMGDMPSDVARHASHDPKSRSAFLHTKRYIDLGNGDALGLAYDKWLEAARFTALQARHTVESGTTSATALARLAHAELAAGEDSFAQSAALQAMNAAATHAKDASLDVPAVFAATRVLIALDRADLAEPSLRALSNVPQLALTLAALAIEARNLDDALELLDGLTSVDADILRGRIYLSLNNPQEAVAQLRRAYLNGDPDPDVCADLARALWKLGSARKSIKFARQAVRLAPGRSDISLLFLEYLVSLKRTEEAEREIQRLSSEEVVEPPELTVIRSNIAIAKNDLRRALSLLRRAESSARGVSTELAAEVTGNIARLRYSLGQIRRGDAKTILRSSMQEAPQSLPLVMLFASLCDRTSAGPELRHHYERVSSSASSSELVQLRAQLAYVEARFEDAALLAAQWSKEEPLNAHAAAAAILLNALSSEDLAATRMMVRSLLHRFDSSCGLFLNNAAYVLVLSGQPRLAESILRDATPSADLPEFVLQATRGLIHLAQGQTQDGLRYYRRAAELADRLPDSGHMMRTLMTIHQGFALWRLGKFSELTDISVRAAALPPVNLPPDWEELCEFLLLHWACDKAGCPWPPMLA